MDKKIVALLAVTLLFMYGCQSPAANLGSSNTQSMEVKSQSNQDASVKITDNATQSSQSADASVSIVNPTSEVAVETEQKMVKKDSISETKDGSSGVVKTSSGKVTSFPDEVEDNAVTGVKEMTLSEEKTGVYSVSFKYPEVVMNGDAYKVKAKLNKAFSDLAKKEVSRFKELVKDDPATKGVGSTLTASYEVLSSSTPELFVKFNISTQIVGAVHSDDYVRTVNLNTADGTVVTLDKVFKKGAYLTVLSDKATKAFDASLAKFTSGDKDQDADIKDSVHQLTAAKAANFENFSMVGDNFVVYFPTLKGMGGYEGLDKVEIPLADLSKYLLKDGAAAGYAE